MKKTAKTLQQTLNKALPLLKAISKEAAAEKPQPNKWSKKEIIGHLIDSACNNHQKMVRTQFQKHLDFVGYQQDDWVEIQQYQQADWSKLLKIWIAYNLQIVHLIKTVSKKSLKNTLSINGEGLYSLEFIMQDYVVHLEHHLKTVLPDAGFEGRFLNVYNA
jgi:ribosomal protein L6P/L9E